MTCWYPDLADKALNGLYAQIWPSLTKFFEGAGYLPDWDIALMRVAYNLEPALLHPALLIERVPYTRPGSFLERMMATVQRGWLYEENEKFGLTAPGREIIEGMYELGDRLQAKVTALTQPEMGYLLSLFNRVIGQIKRLSDPERKPAFKLSLLFDRGSFTVPLVQVHQQILVTLAFREDAYMAAWHPYEADGQLWEAFTLIWQEQACNAAELAQCLPHRNYTESDYTSALEKLTARGWITSSGSRFIAQEQATRMYLDVEETTNRMFNTAFASLSRTEMGDFHHLLEKLALMVTPKKKTE